MIKSFIKKNLKAKYAIFGFPGIGNIGLLTAGYLIDQLKAEKVGEIFESSFPPQAISNKDSTIAVSSTNLHMYNDILLGISPAQPKDPFKYSFYMLDFLKKIKVKTLFTIGGYSRTDIEDNVYLYSYDQSIVEKYKEYGLPGAEGGLIFGIVGVLGYLAKYYNIESLIMLKTTKFIEIPDYSSAKFMLRIFEKMFNLSIDFENLDSMEKELNKKIEMMTKNIEELEKESKKGYY